MQVLRTFQAEANYHRPLIEVHKNNHGLTPMMPKEALIYSASGMKCKEPGAQKARHIILKTVVTPFRQHYFGEVRLFEVGQTRPMYV